METIANVDWMDGLAICLGYLVVLSLVNEKLSSFIKIRFFKDTSAKRSFDVATELEIVKVKEKSKELKVLVTSIITGIVISFITNSNFFQLIRGDISISKDGSWGDAEGKITGAWVVGCTITGVFLSGGSKFFHDLLDIVLEMKNIRRLRREGTLLDNMEKQGILPKGVAPDPPLLQDSLLALSESVLKALVTEWGIPETDHKMRRAILKDALGNSVRGIYLYVKAGSGLTKAEEYLKDAQYRLRLTDTLGEIRTVTVYPILWEDSSNAHQL